MLAKSFLATLAGAALIALGTFLAPIQGVSLWVSYGLVAAGVGTAFGSVAWLVAKSQEWI